jgi:molecular chaperone GrpE
MTTAGGQRPYGDAAGTEADTAPVPGDGPGDDSTAEEADEVLDGELIEDGVPADEVVEAEDVDLDPLGVALAQRDEYLDSLRRLQAEFENYKKRVAKQQADQVARAAASLVDKLLPVLDALDLATDHVGDADSSEAKALVAASGLLHGVLAKEGLERIDPAGEEFDPNAHEAVGQVPAPDDAESRESGEPLVAQVMRAGYRWNGTVVRPAMVMVQA